MSFRGRTATSSRYGGGLASCNVVVLRTRPTHGYDDAQASSRSAEEEELSQGAAGSTRMRGPLRDAGVGGDRLQNTEAVSAYQGVQTARWTSSRPASSWPWWGRPRQGLPGRRSALRSWAGGDRPPLPCFHQPAGPWSPSAPPRIRRPGSGRPSPPGRMGADPAHRATWWWRG